ncbi:unnamed protein product, partial [Hapterophycus canaliculatus]
MHASLALLCSQVKWRDVLLSMRYQNNLLQMYKEREAFDKNEASSGGGAGGSSSSNTMYSSRSLPFGRKQQNAETVSGRSRSPSAGGFSTAAFSRRKKAGDGAGDGGAAREDEDGRGERERAGGEKPRARAGGPDRSERPSSESPSAGSSAVPAEVIMPRDHFHGPTFHALLHEYRTENSAAVAKKAAEEEEAEGGGGRMEEAHEVGNAIDAKESGAKEAAVDAGLSGVPGEVGTVGDRGRRTNGSAVLSLPPGGKAAVPDVVLPIDAYREQILEHVRNNRVTVIHGETGSGKSTRIPVMLVEEALDQIAADEAEAAEAAAAAAAAEQQQEEDEALLEETGLGDGTVSERGTGPNGGSADRGSERGDPQGNPRGSNSERSGGGRRSKQAAAAAPRSKRPRMFVSQPRRAATRALVQRVKQEAKRSGRRWGVGLRLGHGVREGP